MRSAEMESMMNQILNGESSFWLEEVEAKGEEEERVVVYRGELRSWGEGEEVWVTKVQLGASKIGEGMD
jgi:hypothetical protein